MVELASNVIYWEWVELGKAIAVFREVVILDCVQRMEKVSKGFH